MFSLVQVPFKRSSYGAQAASPPPSSNATCIHKGQLHASKRHCEKDGAKAFLGQCHLPEPKVELRRLQHENVLLRQERDILKKAIAFFSEPKAP